ncbi:hypothetical protein S40285_09141 [Stachybotrys chlorohalonatus IBT 40285]|uniref:Carboxylic ester hydrolase n=1 Tax=Stachybotrys chlorohalonatus (strain IBT 40285) TaxID=1283841 RepID=A0A084QW48_STAC4|nr:hypothetical protein S40285_09141 [Stachybotrys chlorohalonata IBT 40285]
MTTSWTSTTGILLSLATSVLAVTASPVAHTLNGTYLGAHLPTWNQDAFLGMPFAQPPLGKLRFRAPQSINETFKGERFATNYGYSCRQFSQATNTSEDCLTVNVVRPAGEPAKLLPVLVWIYGGGLYWGSSADPQYNLSGIVEVSQEINEPIIAVSFNYRLGIWGFLQNLSLLREGSANAGLLDQRLALQWVQENIAAFGGDPDRVVIWGESAGAQSIAYHMYSYEGRNYNLYHGAILESGGVTGAQIHDLSYYNVAWENLTRATGCWTQRDQLACLRDVDTDALVGARQSLTWNPIIDGTFLTGYPSQLTPHRKFNAVPMIIGANTDEGFAIGNPSSEQDLYTEMFTWRNYALTPPTIRRLLDLYPNDPCIQPPYLISNCSTNPTRGAQWRRALQIGGDVVMISVRRKMAELWAGIGTAVYSYRFDQMPWNGDPWGGVKHFDNVAFSFQNISGLLGPSPTYDSHAKLARDIGEAYVRFVNRLDPNPPRGKGKSETLLPSWPKYSRRSPKNMVLNATRSWVEDDVWRKEAIAYINTYSVERELYS